MGTDERTDEHQFWLEEIDEEKAAQATCAVPEDRSENLPPPPPIEEESDGTTQ